MLQSTSEQLLPYLQIMHMIHGCAASQAVYAAAELRLADFVQDGPKSVAQLASATGTNEKNLYRLLRALVSLGIFSENEPGLFGPTALSACLLSEDPRTLYHLARLTGDWPWKALGELMYSVRTGDPAFDHLFGKEVWRYFAEDNPEAGALFGRAMTSMAGPVDAQLADAYDFSAFQTLVDVGGGHGGFLITVLKRYPALQGILFDRAEVIEQARKQVVEAGLADRIELVAGDFFQEVPKGGDAYFMRQILLDWEDEECKIILRNCIQTMNPGGTLLVSERVLAPGRADLIGKLMDLILMVNTSGRVRDEVEYRKLFAATGLTLKSIIPTQSDYKIMEVVVA